MECRGLEDNKTCPLYEHANSKLGRQHQGHHCTGSRYQSIYELTVTHDMNDV